MKEPLIRIILPSRKLKNLPSSGILNVCIPSTWRSELNVTGDCTTYLKMPGNVGSSCGRDGTQWLRGRCEEVANIIDLRQYLQLPVLWFIPTYWFKFSSVSQFSEYASNSAGFEQMTLQKWRRNPPSSCIIFTQRADGVPRPSKDGVPRPKKQTHDLNVRSRHEDDRDQDNKKTPQNEYIENVTLICIWCSRILRYVFLCSLQYKDIKMKTLYSKHVYCTVCTVCTVYSTRTCTYSTSHNEWK